ncbi:MAG: NAD(P)/FAD-dependent oxidoreductase [Bacteroidaceae bacterium]|nr:NAD(P)/FAD-dependent oxidoreductase [Bacteroidaceae bacterium]
MKKERVIIIGAGLGGLECGYILAKNGMQVTVLEHEAQVGGCLQTFRRGAALFDTGFHYVGALDEGESLHTLFSYFDLMGLPWKKLDEDCFDEVVIGEDTFAFANKHQRFYERMAARFPKEREGLKKYVTFLKEVGDHIFGVFQSDEHKRYTYSLLSRSAYEFLNETIKDPLLRKVLSGTSLKMELNAPTLPLYTFAQINDSFIRSAWRLRGGGSQIADKLVEGIQAMGGEVRTRAAVTYIKEENGKAVGVSINDEDYLEADWIVSSVHPSHTVSLVKDSKVLRNIYRNRISHLDNTFGMFTANIRLKPGLLPYVNRNIFVHRADADLWNVNTLKTESVLVNYSVPEPYSSTAVNIDLLSPMSWSEVKKWVDFPVGRRGEDYVSFKQEKTEECIRLVEHRLPELRGAVERVFTSTPLSYQSYISSAEGSAFGIRKDYNNPMYTVLTPRTPIPNLLLTGQSLNLHGVLGVSMTSFLTCAEILGMDTIRKELKIENK